MKKTALPIPENNTMQENITLRQAEDYLDYAENNNLDIDIYNLMGHVLGINYYIPIKKDKKDNATDKTNRTNTN